ncbi:MAG: hypothetical protein KAT35_03770, partial [Candidatus Aenigmarchaeota archaeon]|nr:hypothetical protein [Candidatus Aenigmarchaeota archaeon]
LRVKESDYEKGLKAMAEFYGNFDIMDYVDGDINGLKIRETVSEKYRPSIIVVDDKDTKSVKYVTNVTAPEPMYRDEKLDAMGFDAIGPKLGHPEELYVTNPGDLIEIYV